MKGKYYTSERAQQIVIALLKAHGIRKVIASPGTTNCTLVYSLQQDSFFEMFSSVDERSAAYMACGMAAESGEPVVITCTGATASRNYMPGLTEAFYRKLPVLAITTTQGNYKIGNLIAQNIDRRVIPNDIAIISVNVPTINTPIEEHEAELNVNNALLELSHHGGGPVHINLATTYSRDYSTKALPSTTVINRIMSGSEFPGLKGKIAIAVGSHPLFTESQTKAIDRFCATYNAIVLCDHTSGYKGQYRALIGLINSQKASNDFQKWDILIHIGEVSGDYSGICGLGAKEVWRVSEDGKLRDTFGKLRYVFEMPEQTFFEHYTEGGLNSTSRIMDFHSYYQTVYSRIPELPFSNLWMAQFMAQRLPENSVLHIGILNSLRAWNMFEIPSSVPSYCNVGGFGIDGISSSLIGASLASPEKLFFGIIGDLAFFYDLNSIGNRHIGNNIRILLVNNGMGTEFRNYTHPWAEFGEEANMFGAAAGHFGNKSSMLVRHYAEDLGYEYMTASNKNEFIANIDHFLTPAIIDKPIIFEVFTNNSDESDALYAINNIMHDFKSDVKDVAKKVLGSKGIESLKNFVK